MNNFKDQNIIKGKWWKIKKKIEKRITAKYDKIKDWKMDPKGYFLIDIDRNQNLIRVGYCPSTNFNKGSIHELVIEINGNNALEIVNTLIKNNLISTMQHAADMGIELYKAELALKHNFKYIQDKNLNVQS